MPGSIIRVKTALRRLRDNFPRLIGAYSYLDSNYTAVGWQGPAKYPDGTPVAVVALANEFGTFNDDGSVRIPARPFVRPAYAENKPAILALRQQVVSRVNEGRMRPEKALDILGFRMMSFIRRKILSNVGPPLAPSTLAKKRAEGRPGVTLINTRRMLDELTYHIYAGHFGRGSQSENAKAAQEKGRQASIKANASAKIRLQKAQSAKQIRAEKTLLKRQLSEAKAKTKAQARRDKKKAQNHKKKEQRNQRETARLNRDRATINKARGQKDAKLAAIRLKAKTQRNSNRQKKKIKAEKEQTRKDLRRARKSFVRRATRASRQEVQKRYGASRRPAKSHAARAKVRARKVAARQQQRARKEEHKKKASFLQQNARRKKNFEQRQKQAEAERIVRERYKKQRRAVFDARQKGRKPGGEEPL